LGDAGRAIRGLGASAGALDVWLRVLPAYAELQRGEAAFAEEYIAHGLPDLRLPGLPPRFSELAGRSDLPIEAPELRELAALAGRFAELCAELAAHGVPSSVQHGDLHYSNVYLGRGQPRVLDWGDSSIGHPF